MIISAVSDRQIFHTDTHFLQSPVYRNRTLNLRFSNKTCFIEDIMKNCNQCCNHPMSECTNGEREREKNRDGRFVALKGNKSKCACMVFIKIITGCFLSTFKISFINNSGDPKFLLFLYFYPFIFEHHWRCLRYLRYKHTLMFITQRSLPIVMIQICRLNSKNERAGRKLCVKRNYDISGAIKLYMWTSGKKLNTTKQYNMTLHTESCAKQDQWRLQN